MNKRLLVIIVSSFLLSCADSPSDNTINKTALNAQKSNTEKVKYTCNRGAQLSVNFIETNNKSNKNIAIINGFGEQAITLSNKAVTSGFLYSNGKYFLRGKGQQVTWTVGRMTPFQCSVGDKVRPQKDVK